MRKLKKFSTNEMDLGAQTKGTCKKSPVLKYIHPGKKNFSMKKTRKLDQCNSRSEIVVSQHTARRFQKSRQFRMNMNKKKIKCPFFMKCVPK